MEENIQEMIAKYRAIKQEHNRHLVNKTGEQSQGFYYGSILICDLIIQDLREMLIQESRCGV